jgi:hypothetical protein
MAGRVQERARALNVPVRACLSDYELAEYRAEVHGETWKHILAA